MGRVGARIDVPGQASDAEALWYDLGRWPSFVDGCKYIARETLLPRDIAEPAAAAA